MTVDDPQAQSTAATRTRGHGHRIVAIVSRRSKLPLNDAAGYEWQGSGRSPTGRLEQTVVVDEEPPRSMPIEDLWEDTIEDLWDQAQFQAEIDKAAERARSLKRRKADLQARDWETWSVVKRIVDDANPAGLLAMGCPSDEYDQAVVYLTGRLLVSHHLSREDLSDRFRDHYGSEPDADAIRFIFDSLEQHYSAVAANAVDGLDDGPLHIDFERRTVTFDQGLIDLTSNEFDGLSALFDFEARSFHTTKSRSWPRGLPRIPNGAAKEPTGLALGTIDPK